MVQFSLFLLSSNIGLSLWLSARELLLDASLLTCKVAEVIELSATNLTYLVHLDRVDVW